MPSWQDLNAFADGELSPDEAAAVGQALAGDPGAVQDLAAILRLKRTMRGRRRKAAPAAAAVMVALAMAVAVAAALVGGGRDTATATDPAREHAVWASRELAEPLPGGALTALPPPPDLSAAGLTLVMVRALAGPDGRMLLHMGWVGTRGCRVSLFASPGAGGADSDSGPGAAGGEWSWVLDGTAYRLLASGMPPERLEAIAEAAHESLRRRQAPDGDTRALLARSRAASPPCIG